MGKRKTEQRIKAIELHKQGFSRRQIAERVGVSQATVKTWIALYKNGQKDLLEDRPRPHTKSYCQKLKIAAVQAHIREGKTIAEATALYGISDTSLLRRWCREYRETGCISSSKPGRPSSKSYEDPAARIRELEMQVEILKKYWNCKGGDDTEKQIQSHSRIYRQIFYNSNVSIHVGASFFILLLA